MQKLLVIRNDKLGDFVLTFPALALLKNSYPDLKITALVPSYTAPIAEICPYIDEIIVDAKDKKDKSEFNRVLNEVKNHKFDAVISFFSNWHNAKLTWQSNIKYRLAPATKLFQILYNHRLTQRRSQSIKAEYEYNMDLARHFLVEQKINIVEPSLPYLSFNKSAVKNQRDFLANTLGLSLDKKWIFIHSGSGGSANNLSLEQYAQLSKGLLEKFDCHIILTAGPNESEKAHHLAQKINHSSVAIYDKNKGLVDFAHSLATADLFIAGSTGPLHLSGALNIPTIGFYPSNRSASPIRWQPINAQDKHIAFCPPTDKDSQINLTLISIEQALINIIPFIKKQWG